MIRITTFGVVIATILIIIYLSKWKQKIFTSQKLVLVKKEKKLFNDVYVIKRIKAGKIVFPIRSKFKEYDLAFDQEYESELEGKRQLLILLDKINKIGKNGKPILEETETIIN